RCRQAPAHGPDIAAVRDAARPIAERKTLRGTAHIEGQLFPLPAQREARAPGLLAQAVLAAGPGPHVASDVPGFERAGTAQFVVPALLVGVEAARVQAHVFPADDGLAPQQRMSE